MSSQQPDNLKGDDPLAVLFNYVKADLDITVSAGEVFSRSQIALLLALRKREKTDNAEALIASGIGISKCLDAYDGYHVSAQKDKGQSKK